MHKSQTGDKFWNDNKELIITRYNSGESAEKIAKDYNCCGSTISYKLKEWNIPKHKRYNNIYTIDSDYFLEITDEHRAYWYGLLLSDGFVNNTIVSISIKEEYLLYDFKNDLHTDIPIRRNYYNLPTLSIANKIMCKTLLDKGFNHNKSKYIDIDKVKSYVPDNLEHHFIRGMFDGDGSIRYYKYNYQNTIMLHFGYTGTKDVIKYIKNTLDMQNKIVEEGEFTQTICSSNPQKIKMIYDYLYKDATIFMCRKKETFEDIVN